MRAVIEEETSLIMHEIVLVIILCGFSLETSMITDKLLMIKDNVYDHRQCQRHGPAVPRAGCTSYVTILIPGWSDRT